LTDPLYLDVTLKAEETFSQSVRESHNAVIYMIEGAVKIDDTSLGSEILGVFGPGSRVNIKATSEGARFLLIAGKRLEEPVARGGPFVMNTRAEILDAFADLRGGKFG